MEVSGRRKGLRPVECRYRRRRQQNWTPRSDLQTLCTPISCGVFIHLHGLTITTDVFPFYTPPFRVQLQLWPGRVFHDSAREATQTAKLRPKFCRDSSCFHGTLQVFVLPRKRDRRRACVTVGDMLRRETETERCVKAHRRRKKPDLLSPKRKINCRCLLADSPSAPIMETHAKICSAS